MAHVCAAKVAAQRRAVLRGRIFWGRNLRGPAVFCLLDFCKNDREIISWQRAYIRAGQAMLFTKGDQIIF